MKFAAIDIGSNAVRLLVEEVFLENDDYHIEKVSFTRVPIRLGSDVFEDGKISEFKSNQLLKTMTAFSHLMDVHQVHGYRACATSAMREAENNTDVIEAVKEKAGIDIEVIDGEQEAELIFANFFTSKVDPDGDYLYIDVGGGSTECTLIKGGDRVTSKSFKIGTVRMLKGKVSKKDWVAARSWIQDLVEKEDNLVAIGTGGNINRIFKEAGKKYYETISDEQIEYIYDYIKSFSYDQRITKLRLKPDRADVIIPAAEIYYNFMRFADIKEMIVPKVGLSDGIILQQFREWQEKDTTEQ
ncbi:MAG: exopolyphosphatase [Flavobacteriales bacterium]|nr:exopolyphosphatase [Flavobacteriales bacterium]